MVVDVIEFRGTDQGKNPGRRVHPVLAVPMTVVARIEHVNKRQCLAKKLN
jgi:hypothetical protein